ncbi:MAG: zf-HC2 domain-containing protein [Acidimicrobiales bacterium]
MTTTDWHAPPELLTRFALDPATVDDMTAASVEAHLVVCADCRHQMAATARPEVVSASWDAIADQIDQPRPARLERILQRIGVGHALGRLLVATPALRSAGLLAMCVLAAGAVGLSLSADAGGPFLVLAPLLPLAAVAISFAPAADPAGEAGVATALHGVGLVVRRTTAIVAVTFAVLGAAALALPDLGPAAAAWVLPALALTLGTLALGTWVRAEVAVGVLSGAWLAGVWSMWWLADHDIPLADSATFSAAGQMTALAAAVTAAAVVAGRRDHLATLEAFR